jgi:hypothetical protein
MPAQFEEFFWRGQKRYKCNLCEYDDYSLDNMQTHIREVHTEQRKKAPELPMPLLYDEYGTQVQRPKPKLTADEEPSTNLYE